MPGCPKCGNVDIQVMELLTAWNDIEKLQAELKKKEVPAVGFKPAEKTADVVHIPEIVEQIKVVKQLSVEDQNWKDKYEKIKTAYVQTRLDVSGSFGNWDFTTRKRVLEHEISAELGFII